jgi:hypothetical protein
MIITVWALKKRNRRINVAFGIDEETQEHFFIVETKRLVDFKTREITTVITKYGVETFTVLSTLFDTVITDPNVKKRINRESKFERYNATVHNFKTINP